MSGGIAAKKFDRSSVLRPSWATRFCLSIFRLFTLVVHDAADIRSSFMKTSLRRCGAILLACCCAFTLAAKRPRKNAPPVPGSAGTAASGPQARGPKAGASVPVASASEASAPQARGPKAGASVPVASVSEASAGVAPVGAPCGWVACSGSRSDP